MHKPYRMVTIFNMNFELLLVLVLSTIGGFVEVQGTTIVHHYEPLRRSVRFTPRGPKDPWEGRWFPDEVSSRNVVQEHHPTNMGVSKDACDDAKQNITLDLPETPLEYICLTRHGYLEPNPDIPTILRHSIIPPQYHAAHLCLDVKIEYDVDLPSYGPHRPLWPRWGEYKYLPPQRWIHSLEHGGIVVLYHPCAHPFLVDRLKKIVKSCLYRHVITPYSSLPEEQPLAIVAWGWTLLMPDVNEEAVADFIKQHALRGPERMSQDGQYDFMLTKPAKILSDESDTQLCP